MILTLNLYPVRYTMLCYCDLSVLVTLQRKVYFLSREFTDIAWPCIYKGKFCCFENQGCDLQIVHKEGAWPMLSPIPTSADPGLCYQHNLSHEKVLKPLSFPKLSLSQINQVYPERLQLPPTQVAFPITIFLLSYDFFSCSLCQQTTVDQF